MTDIWEEREKALENQWIYNQEKAKLARDKSADEEERAQFYCRNRCPKCGEKIEAMIFRDVPLDKCPGCGGVWLGARDFEILAEKDHRTWFEKWFEREEG